MAKTNPVLKISSGYHPSSSVLVQTSPRIRSHSAAGGRMGGEVWLEQITYYVQFDSARNACAHQWNSTTDVTERKRFDEKLSLAGKTAEMADRAKWSFCRRKP